MISIYLPYMQKKAPLQAALLGLFLLFILQTNIASARPNLTVAPVRVVFEGNMRTASVNLINTGDEAGSFRLSFIRQQMTSTGEIFRLDETQQQTGLFSDQMIRFSPRQVDLEPGQSQVVRLMLRKPRNLADGEYRSHLLMESLPQASKRSLESALSEGNDQISVEIIPIVGISIPIIARHGKLSSSLVLQNPRFMPASQANEKASISVEMIREGSSSSYGDFRVVFVPNTGAPQTMGLVNGVAVYTPNVSRTFTLELNKTPELILKNGRLDILYLKSGKSEADGLISKASIAL